MSTRGQLRVWSVAVALTRTMSIAAIPLLALACGEPPKPPPNAAPQPSLSAWTPPPQVQVGMQDTPSSLRPGEVPDQPLPGSMSQQALPIYQQGFAAWGNGDLQAAKLFFQQATQVDPKAHQAFYSLGVVQDRLKESGASSSYQQALTLVPDYEPAILAYAGHLTAKNNMSEAERMLTEKRGLMPKSAAVTAALAEVKSIQRDTGTAQRLAQEALKLNPDYRPAMVVIARDHYRNRRLDLALYALQAILDGFEPVDENPPRDKDNAEARLLRGLIWREQNKRGAAMEEFRKAYERRPDLVEARVQLATYLLESGGAEEAKPILEGAIRYDADNLTAHLNLGDCYRLLGMYPEAKKELDWVITKDQSLPQVHYDLGLLFLFAPNCTPANGAPAQSPCFAGYTPLQQVQQAAKSLKRFQELRSKGEPDDSDELLNQARLKEGEIQAAQQAAAPPPPPPEVDAGAPATSAAPTAMPATSAAPAEDAGAPAAPSAGQ